MELQTAKGTRDLPPEDQIILERALAVLKKNFEKFGFNPLDTPILELYSTLSSKYAGGAEILKETFKLKDQGGRDLALRYDLTVPFARFIAMNKQLKMPFKRYQVGRVFRDGPISTNRLREFTQCDADIVGARSIVADAECVELFLQCFADLGLDAEVRINNRKILDGIISSLKIREDLREKVILAIDKLDKKSKVEVINEIKSFGIAEKNIAKLFSIMEAMGNKKGNNNALIKKVKAVVGPENEGVKEIKELLQLCPNVNVRFTPSLARGLAYYTGSIFEVYLKNSKIKSSIGSGGRYDQMIGSLMGGTQEFPAVGCSFGLDVIVNALKEKSDIIQKSVVKAYVISVAVPAEKTREILKQLRSAGIPADQSFNMKGISKGLDYADKLRIPYAIIIGDRELAKKKVLLRDMNTGSEQMLTVKEVIKRLS